MLVVSTYYLSVCKNVDLFLSYSFDRTNQFELNLIYSVAKKARSFHFKNKTRSCKIDFNLPNKKKYTIKVNRI
jgi:hypothetical protein